MRFSYFYQDIPLIEHYWVSERLPYYKETHKFKSNVVFSAWRMNSDCSVSVKIDCTNINLYNAHCVSCIRYRPYTTFIVD
jgi:hypothetical protein